MEVRDTTPADLDGILELNNASTPAVNALSSDELARLHGLAAVSLTATIDGDLAGFCLVLGPGQPYASLNYAWFSRWFAARDQPFAYLDRIVVAPAARRAGVGRALYASVLNRLAGQFPELALEVNIRPRNDGSLHFHHQLGCVEVGQQDTDRGAKTVSLMTLRIPDAPAS